MTINYETVCPICGKTHLVELPFESFVLWMYNQVPVQEAFSDLSAEDRELLITGICPDCWNQLFAATIFEQGKERDWYDYEMSEDC